MYNVYERFIELTILPFNNQGTFIIVPIIQRFASGRVEVASPFALVPEKGIQMEITHPVKVLEIYQKRVGIKVKKHWIRSRTTFPTVPLI
ncbi:hypothetical protein NCCP133_30480 [Cytobacillus sp. NCCP-133]|nr:hypothetical protein NCCP133_30480 [Cytobacillus sp. NCCP-133]